MKRTMIAGSLLILCLLFTGEAFSDGTETLGAPTIEIASGSGMVAAGTGLKSQPGVISIDLPAGVIVKQVLLYWGGQQHNTNVTGDDTATVNGIPVIGTLIGGPAYFFSDVYVSAYRADITALNQVGPGSNLVTIEDLDFSVSCDGAGIIAIYDDGVNTSDIDIRDGVDLAFVNFPDPRGSTVMQVFHFDPLAIDRIAHLSLFAASVEDGQPRPNSIEVTVDGVKTTYTDLMNSSDGAEWDTLTLPIDIPANATELTVQVFSRDDDETGYLPASLAWIGAGLSVPTEAPPTGGQGLTPGYWKQPQHFDDWVDYSPGDDYGTIFGVNPSFNKDLLGALSQGGGGEKALGRHATAALLNAASPKVNYLYTKSQVILMVQEAYATGNFEGIKDLLADQNELELGNGGDDDMGTTPIRRLKKLFRKDNLFQF